MKNNSGTLRNNIRRDRLRHLYGGNGYKKCPLCGTPIRPRINIDPATGMIVGEGRGIEVGLSRLCEICWQENSGESGDGDRYRCALLPL